MRIHLFFVSLCLCLVSRIAWSACEVVDTILFSNVDGIVCQMVYVKGVEQPADEWTIQMSADSSAVDPRHIQRFKDGWLIPVPAVEHPTEIRISFADAGSVTHIVKPQKRWTAYLTQHTHFDLGFTDTQPAIWDLQMEYLLDAIALCEETEDWPEESRFRWTIECTSLFEEFAERHPDQLPRLLDYIRDGRIEVAGMYMNLLTELCSGEELCRSLYPIAEFRREYRIPIDTAMHNDIPGITWQLPQLLDSAGIRYLSLRANPIRGRFLWTRTDAPTRPFLWEGPDGSSILVWYTDSYREANFFRGGCPEDAADRFAAPNAGTGYDDLIALIARQEARGTPVDAIQMRVGGDNLGPTPEPSKWARAWNERWAYPRLVVATNRMFFEHIERFRSELDTHRGDITDWWADGAGSAALETGVNRKSHERAGTAETMQALVGEGPDGDYWNVYRSMLLYDEHTFGSHHSKRYTKGGEEQWRIKSGFARTAQRVSRQLLEGAGEALKSAVRTESGLRLVVWNPSSWTRSGIVCTALPEGQAAHDPETNRPLEAQRTGDGWAIRVRDVPPLGWTAYEVRTGSFAAPSGDNVPDRSQSRLSYIYETGGKRESVRPYPESPRYAKSWWERDLDLNPVTEYLGGLFTEFEGVLKAPQGAAWLNCTVTEYGDCNREDVVVSIGKIATEAPEGVYLEFPFDMDRPTVHIQIPFVWMDPVYDRLPCTCADFFSVDRAVDLNDGRRGVTMAMVEAPLVEFGRITTDQWSETLEMDDPIVYSYVMNNYWFTNYPFSQGGPRTFRYAIRRYDGPFDPVAAYRFGEEVARPLEAELVAPGSPGKWAGLSSWSAFVTEPENVVVVAVKPAEDGRGIILRLAETAGQNADVRVSVCGLPVDEIQHCSILEDDVKSAESTHDAVRFRMRPWAIATLRLVSSSQSEPP